MSILFNKSKNKEDVITTEEHCTPTSIYLDFVEESTKLINALYVSDVILETSHSLDSELDYLRENAILDGLKNLQSSVSKFWSGMISSNKENKLAAKKMIKELDELRPGDVIRRLVQEEKQLIKNKELEMKTFNSTINFPNLKNISISNNELLKNVKKSLDLWETWFITDKNKKISESPEIRYQKTIDVMTEINNFYKTNTQDLIDSVFGKVSNKYSFIENEKDILDFIDKKNLGIIFGTINEIDSLYNKINELISSYISSLIKQTSNIDATTIKSAMKMVSVSQESIKSLQKDISTRTQMINDIFEFIIHLMMSYEKYILKEKF